MLELTWSQVHSQRLRRNYLREPAKITDVEQVVRDICGVQAQVMGAAEYALGARLHDANQANVQSVIWEDRRLIKAYGIRGTLHLLVAEDHPMWASAMLSHPSRENHHWYRQFGLDAEGGESLLTAMRVALDGQVLSREELASRVAEQLGPWVLEPLQSAWGEMLAPASYYGIVCFGPYIGTKVSFVRRDQWNSAGTWPYAGDALLDILRVYLRTYGPVTPADVARWFALKMPAVRILLERVRDEVTTVKVQGQEALVLNEDARAPWSDDGPSVRLLPQYDTYVLGCGLREAVVPRPLCDRIFQHGRGRYEGAVAQNILVIDGVVNGMWSREVRRGRLQVTIESFVDLSTRRRTAIEREAERVASFYSMEADLCYAELGAPRR